MSTRGGGLWGMSAGALCDEGFRPQTTHKQYSTTACLWLEGVSNPLGCFSPRALCNSESLYSLFHITNTPTCCASYKETFVLDKCSPWW